jgi:hypothetical protein
MPKELGKEEKQLRIMIRVKVRTAEGKMKIVAEHLLIAV